MADDDNTPDEDGYIFGHLVYGDGPYSMRYRDTDELVRIPSQRPCPLCGELPTKEGHDPCIANLPGVVNACCGHGVEPGYVMFATGHVIRGEFDREEMRARQIVSRALAKV